MTPAIQHAIIYADHFEVRDHPDDVDARTFDRLARAETYWRSVGGLIYAVSMTSGETLIGSHW